jgi:hypothetical protein
MKDWFESAVLVENAFVEVGFVLFSDFYYGPDRHTDIAERKLIEPLYAPNMPRSVEELATTNEVQGHVNELIKYYSDVVRLSKKHGKSFEQVRQYFWVKLFIRNSDGSFHVSFPWYDTLSEMDGLLMSLANPPANGEVHWDRDQGWELEMDAHNEMLFVREWDPDYEEVHVTAKLPLLSLSASSSAALELARAVIATLTNALSVDAWTTHKRAINFNQV